MEKRDITTIEAGRPSAPTGLTAVPLVARNATGVIVTDVVEVVEVDGENVPAAVQTNQSATSVNLYWYWPQTDGGDGITTFRVEVSKTGQWPGSTDEASLDAGALNTVLGDADFGAVNVAAGTAFGSTAETPQQFTHTDAATTFLTQGKSLQYRVFAENGAGHRSLPSSESSQSTVTYAMTQATKPAPGMPTGVVWELTDAEPPVDAVGVTAKAATHHHSEVNLSWMSPEFGNAPTAYAYRVDLASSKSVRTRNADGIFSDPVTVLAWNERERDTRHTDPTYDHRGWRPGPMPQSFNYRVFAKDGGLIGESSEVNTQTVDAQTAPEPVVGLNASVTSAKQIDVSWTEPGNDGGTSITRYCLLTTSNATVSMTNVLCADGASIPSTVKRTIIDAPTVGVLTERAPGHHAHVKELARVYHLPVSGVRYKQGDRRRTYPSTYDVWRLPQFG